jgi:predicted RNase H-like HicB family nuclease
MRIKVLLEAQDGGGFTVTVPALPGCISQGETREEAIENIREAITLLFDEEGTHVGEYVDVVL